MLPGFCAVQVVDFDNRERRLRELATSARRGLEEAQSRAGLVEREAARCREVEAEARRERERGEALVAEVEAQK